MTILFVFCLSIVLFGMGWPLVASFDRGKSLNIGERLSVAYLLGCLILYLVVSIVGLYRLDEPAVWMMLAFCAFLSIPGLRQMPWKRFVDATGQELKLSVQDHWVGFLWITVGAIGLSSLVQGMAPPNDYDSLMYHLAQPQFDVEMNRISVAWDRANGTELFPALAGHLSRVSLATVGSGAAQMLHGMLGLIGALGAALLTLRLGYGRRAMLGAAIFFLSCRVVIWEMATVEVDVPLATFTIFAAIVYLELRKTPKIGLALLFGILIGCGILVKYHGFIVAAAFAPLLIWDLARKHITPAVFLLGPFVSLLTLVPHMVRNFALTGNPIYPILNTLFIPDKHNFFVIAADSQGKGYGTGRDLVSLFVTPWNMFINPMHVFDGMIFGAPYLFAFAPLLLLDPVRLKKCLPIITVMTGYFLGWFYLMDLQVRFLTPVIPLLSVLAVAGIVAFWSLTEKAKVPRLLFLAIATILAVNQSMFVAVYSVVRLPVAVGLLSPETYHLKTPTMNGAMFVTCTFIKENLNPGEKYFSILQPHSYYCPQAPVVRTYFPDEAKWWIEQADVPPKLTLSEFIQRAEESQFKYYIAPYKTFNRRNKTARMIVKKADLSVFRHGEYLQPVFESLTPLKADLYTAVYDGKDVLAGLKKQLAR